MDLAQQQVREEARSSTNAANGLPVTLAQYEAERAGIGSSGLDALYARLDSLDALGEGDEEEEAEAEAIGQDEYGPPPLETLSGSYVAQEDVQLGATLSLEVGDSPTTPTSPVHEAVGTGAGFGIDLAEDIDSHVGVTGAAAAIDEHWQ